VYRTNDIISRTPVGRRRRFFFAVRKWYDDLNFSASNIFYQTVISHKRTVAGAKFKVIRTNRFSKIFCANHPLQHEGQIQCEKPLQGRKKYLHFFIKVLIIKKIELSKLNQHVQVGNSRRSPKAGGKEKPG